MKKNKYKVIESTKVKVVAPINKIKIYLNAFIVAVDSITGTMPIEGSKKYIMSAIYYGLKYIILDFKENRKLENGERKQIDINKLKNQIKFIKAITEFMSKLTPKEFMQLYPIKKEYDGAKYSAKDYFSTMEEINKYNINDPIDSKRIQNFLGDYWNKDILSFQITNIGILSDLRQFNGEKSVLEEYLEDKDLKMYTINKKDGYIKNNMTGEITGLNLKKNSHLKLVRNAIY